MKKLLAIFAAAVLTLTLAISSFAAGETYIITIDTDATGHTYQAYQIFSGDLAAGDDGNKVLSNIQWGTGVNGDAALAALKADTTIGSNFTDATTAADVAKAMEGKDAAFADSFAAVIGQHLTSDMTTSTAVTGGYAILGLAAGYYLVKDADNSLIDAENEAYTKYIIEVVGSVTVEPKSSVPTVVKKIQENVKVTTDNGFGAGYNDVADYNIGDAVPFKLIGTLPTTLGDYDTYSYTFHDTLSAGLTYNSDAVVTVGDADVTSSFTIEHVDGTLTISCTDVKAIPGITSTSEITVNYTAELNDSAIIGLDGNINDVYLEYSNNPNGEGTGKTPKDTVIVFTYELDVTKQSGDTAPKNLSGAEFVLYRLSGEAKEYATVNADGKITGWASESEVFDADNITVKLDAAKLTSDANGQFKVVGLDDGTYYLKETVAPAGYNLLESDIKLVIAATTVNGQDWNGTPASALTAIKLTVDDKTNSDGNVTTGAVATTVINNAGSVLPSTGGMGTTIFTIVGIALCIGAAVLLIAKRKMNSEK